MFLLLVLFFSIASLYGEVPEPKCEKIVEEELESQKPLTSHFQITPKVNVITGEYVEEECDLVVQGVEPLSIRRFYGHHNPSTYIYGFWRYNPEHYCVANFELKKEKNFVAFGHENGNIFSLEDNRGGGVYKFKLKNDSPFTYREDSGKNHPLNAKVTYRKKYGDKEKFAWEGEILDGSGRKRTFLSDSFPWLTSFSKQTKHMEEGVRTRYEPDLWTPYKIPILEERKPNGNIIQYTYAYRGNKLFPGSYFLAVITAYNSSKTKVLGFCKFDYIRDKRKSFSHFLVEGSDGRKAIYYPIKDFFLNAAITPNAPIYMYGPEKNGTRLKSTERPEGRLCIIEYNEDNKVSMQKGPIGPNGELLPFASYIYHKGATEMWDGEGNKTIYRYDDNKKITSFEVYDKDKLYLVEKYVTDPKTGNLTLKTLSDGKGTLIYKEELFYDKNQNVIEERCGDGKECYKAYYTYSDDGFNLKLREWDDFGKDIHYAYLPNSNLLISELTFEGEKIRKRAFYNYDDCAVCIKRVIDDGLSKDEKDLKGVTFRKITKVTPRDKLPCFGLPEIVEEKTIDEKGNEILLSKVLYTYTSAGNVEKEDHYDSKNQLCYTLLNKYDDKERLIASTNALGNTTNFTYDANFNLTEIKGPGEDLFKKITYDKANRPIKMEERLKDGIVLETKQKYDKCGRVISKTDPLGKETKYFYDFLGRVVKILYPDSTFIERSYDFLGNVKEEKDAKGFITKKTFNFRSEVKTILHPDGTKEEFTYTLDGKLASHTDTSGVKKIFQYDVLGHEVETSFYSSSGKFIKKLSSIWSSFLLLKKSDANNIETSFTYDFAGRKKIEEREVERRVFVYFYDSLGRLFKTQKGDMFIIETFDFLNQVVERRVEHKGKIKRKEEYVYDELGNRVELKTFKGSERWGFDTNGKELFHTNFLGDSTQTSYSYTEELTKTITNPQGLQKILKYDFKEQLIEETIKNPKDQTLQQVLRKYDPNGNKIEEIENVFEGNHFKKTITHLWEYGPKNRLERVIEAGQKETLFTYDKNGKLEKIIKPDKVVLTHLYNDCGQLERFFSKDIDYHYFYDKNDRLIKVKDLIHKTEILKKYNLNGDLIQDTINGFTTSYEYDPYHRRESTILPDKSLIDYSYDGEDLYQVERKGYIYTYSERDLKGNVSKIILPSNLGEIFIERDPLSRVKKLESPYYSLENSYDSVGNLKEFQYKDPQGRVKESFAYDELNQLIEENGYHYTHDSLYNRVRCNEKSLNVNNLCQLIQDENHKYEYDLNGNLKNYRDCLLEYDSQNRLIKVLKGEFKYEYGYDHFHRRIWKKIFKNEKLKKQLNYIWDGDREIGVMDEEGEILELRVMGEGLGAEIGSSVFLEFDGKTTIPLHDHRGNIAVILDAYWQEPIATYRYTAFGIEKTEGKLAPWRFQNKRIDEETGLVFFGRRYLAPDLGRWITADPQGYVDGRNLYAYLKNSPLNACDPYGLWKNFKETTSFGDFCRNLRMFAFSGIEQVGKHFIPIPGLRDFVEATGRFGNGGRFHQAADYRTNYSRIESISGKKEGSIISYHNGLNVTYREAHKTCMEISEMNGGASVTLMYKGSAGLLTDCLGALFGKLGKRGSYEKMCANSYTSMHKNDPDKQFFAYAHSRGTTNLVNTSHLLSNEILDKMDARLFGSATIVRDGIFGKVTNYISMLDAVAWTNPLACGYAFACPDESVKFLSPKTWNPLNEHSIMGDTYREVLQDYGRIYRETYK